MREQGTIKRFMRERGFGFLVSDWKPDGEIFFHVKNISRDSFATEADLPGARIEFETTIDHHGKRRAANAVVLPKPKGKS
jgi:cold shock CspA family protein